MNIRTTRVIPFMLLGAMAFAGCQDRAETQAEAQADALENQADVVRDQGEAAADATEAQTEAQADQLENKADAVRESADDGVVTTPPATTPAPPQ